MKNNLLTPQQYARLDQIARSHNLQFVRMFGSAAKSLKKARDVDLAIDRKIENLGELTQLMDELSKLFVKPVDLIELSGDVPPLLSREIGKSSVALWEREQTGRYCYAELIDKLLAISEDERLSLTMELREASIRSVQRKLKDVS